MSKQVNPVPQGYHTVTPYLIFKDAAPAIDFYKKALGASEVMRMNGPDGRVSHAEIKIGDSLIMLGSAPPNSGLGEPKSLNGSTVNIFLYLPDVDKVFNAAVSAGAKATQHLQDMFWGDRYGTLVDPFGHSWSLATHVEDVSPEEMGKRQQEMAKFQQAKAAR